VGNLQEQNHEEETHVITRARYEEISLFSHIPCLEKCDALFCDAGIW
jgi:hypothetical protein